MGHTSLTPAPKQHAWFTDGTAKYIGQERHQKAIAYNPHTQVTLETTRKHGSSQLAELKAAHQALVQERGESVIYLLTPGQ